MGCMCIHLHICLQDELKAVNKLLAEARAQVAVAKASVRYMHFPIHECKVKNAYAVCRRRSMVLHRQAFVSC